MKRQLTALLVSVWVSGCTTAVSAPPTIDQTLDSTAASMRSVRTAKFTLSGSITAALPARILEKLSPPAAKAVAQSGLPYAIFRVAGTGQASKPDRAQLSLEYSAIGLAIPMEL